ncbi:glycoside hydrolase [Pseudoneurospora amorphoporcata]|uniref:Probable beta-glucosidase btgE n=1 Tax=Pseudoneurospora amorphoporcata TaxID=241081 RepID=A0AAN6NT98_9PEZI|nr:glycoside hydrolase [Pseudoneurospora amorphoporcata]
MKGTIVAAAAILAGGASANRLHHRHLHQPLFEKRVHNESEICVPGCTTIWTTITGPAGLYTPPAPPSTAAPATSSAITTSEPLPTISSSLVFANTSSIAVPSTTEVVVVPSTTEIVVVPTTTEVVVVPTTTSQGPITVPTPIQQTCPTPGTYTFPATTVVLTETKTVCGASSTVVPSGTHTLGGVTTVVETATTVVCPVATTKTAENGVVTSVVELTTYVCPSAGTYTIAPITTTVTDSEPVTVVVPVVETYCPGTYSAPAVVTTVTETNVVVYCPFTAVEPPVASTQASEPTSVVAPPPVVSVAPPVVSVAPPVSEVKPSVTSSSAAPEPTAPTGNLGGRGDKWAMTYTPFTQDSQCKSAAEVMTDIKAIAKAGFTTLRVYSTDCDTLPNVGAAAEATGLRLILGIFIGTVGCENGSPDVSEQIAAIKSWGRFDMVDLVVVGNEALFNGFCTVGQLKDLIYHVKSELGSAGYSGPYTTTDVVSAWQANDVTDLCNAIDVVACNAHAYFNANTLPEQAGTFVAGQLEIVEKICNKPGFVMETGWPTAGECIGKACPGREQQKTALAAIKQELGTKVVFFSFTDDHWKQPGSCNCEQHWGCGEVFGAQV